MALLSCTIVFLLWLGCTAHEEKPCDYPVIENGKLSRSLEYYRSYYFPMRFGQHADYHCNDGYSTPSGQPWVQIVCSERGWSPEPKCLKNCRVGHLENGYVSHNRKDIYKEGERVKYVCNADYYTEHEDGEVTCTKDDWSPPRCIRKKQCQNIDFDNGYFTSRKQTFHLQENVTYSCLTGFVTPEGQERGVIQCKENGWTPPPKCISEGGKCGPPPVIENGDILSSLMQEYPQGTTLQYKCPSLYVLEGSQYITCADGQWTSPPVCLVPCTTSEEDMMSSNIQLKCVRARKLYVSSGDFIEFQCRRGYVKDPASSSFRVLCVDGMLEHPRCKPGRNCILDERTMEGNKIQLRSSRSSSTSTYRSGDYIDFECKSLHRKVSRDESFQAECLDGVIQYPTCRSILG